MYSYRTYDKFYNPFRRDGVRASTRQLGKGNLVVVEVVGAANNGITAPVTITDAINVQLSLQACPRSDLFIDGWHVDGIERSARSVQIHDLRRSPVADIRDPFHVLHFYLSRRVLDALSADKPLAPIDDMRIQPKTGGGQDPTIEHLIPFCFFSGSKSDEISSLFADHLTLALAAHVTTRYAGIRSPQPNPKGGLSPWQQRRAVDMLHANFDGAVSLSELAAGFSTVKYLPKIGTHARRRARNQNALCKPIPLDKKPMTAGPVCMPA
jgi:AraC family transcriptional regulator